MTDEMKAIREKIACRIKQMMDETKETTYDVAKVVDRKAASISHWRVGRYLPQADEIDKLAVHWNVNPGWLDGTSENRDIIDMMKPEEDKIYPYDFTETMFTQDMQRMFPINSLMFIKRMSSVPDNTVALLELDNVRTVRRVFNKGSSYFLISENPEVLAVFVKSHERNRVNIIGKVVHVGFDVI